MRAIFASGTGWERVPSRTPPCSSRVFPSRPRARMWNWFCAMRRFTGSSWLAHRASPCAQNRKLRLRPEHRALRAGQAGRTARRANRLHAIEVNRLAETSIGFRGGAAMGRSSISRKAQQFTESVIREMTRLALEHKAINLAQGFPDFAAPEE